MNKYVVAFLSLYDGELKQEIVEAESALHAGISYMNWWEYAEDEPQTLEALYEEAFNGDCYIHVLDLSKALGTGRPGGGLQTRISQFNSEPRFR